LASDRTWLFLSKLLLLSAAAVGTHVALGGASGVLEVLFFTACVGLNELRTRAALDRSGPLMTVFWVFLFIAIPACYLMLKLAWPHMVIPSPVPVEPIIISLAVPFQIFAAYVPSIPKAQHLVLAFVLVEAILGARARTDNPEWPMLLILLGLVGLCLIVGHATATAVKVRSAAGRTGRSRAHGGRLLRPGAALLFMRAGTVALVCAAVLFMLAPRFSPEPKPPTSQRNPNSRMAPRPAPITNPNLPPGSVNDGLDEGPSSMSGLSNTVSLGDFNTILRDHAPVGTASISGIGGGMVVLDRNYRPLLKATSLASFNGQQWYTEGKANTGPQSLWREVQLGAVINEPPPVLPEGYQRIELQFDLAQPSVAAPMQVFTPGRMISLLDIGAPEAEQRNTKIEVFPLGDECRMWPPFTGQLITGYRLSAILHPDISEIPDIGGRRLTDQMWLALPDQWKHELDLRWLEQTRFRSPFAGRPLALAAALERWFKYQGGFRYSLDYRPDDLLTFITNTDERIAHCEYYASAMVVLLRHLGVPSRLCIGYAPKTRGQSPNQWLVKRSDAHAWVEVYIGARGWVSFDPTPPDTGAELDPNTSLIGGPTNNPFAEPDKDLFTVISEYSDRHRTEALAWVSKAATEVGSTVASALEAPWELLPEGIQPRRGWPRWVLTLVLVGVPLVLAIRLAMKRLRRRRMVRQGMGDDLVIAGHGAADVAVSRARSVWRELLGVLSDHGFVRARHQTPREFADTVISRGGHRFTPVATAAIAYSQLRYGETPESEATRLESAIRSAIDELKRVDLGKIPENESNK